MKTRWSGLWVWQPYSTLKGHAFATGLEGLSPAQSRKVLTGERASVKQVTVTETTRGRFVDQLGTFTSILIVSEKLRAVIEQIPGARVQFIPIAIKGKPKLSYTLLNVLDAAPAIDLQASKVKYVAGTQVVRQIEKLAPRAAHAGVPPLFHPEELRHIVLVVEEVKTRLLAASDHPGELVRLEQYRVGL